MQQASKDNKRNKRKRVRSGVVRQANLAQRPCRRVAIPGGIGDGAAL